MESFEGQSKPRGLPIVAPATITIACTLLHVQVLELEVLLLSKLGPEALQGADDAADLVKLAALRRRTLQVGHVERFNPAWTAAAEVTANAKYVEAVRASRFPGRCLDVGVVSDHDTIVHIVRFEIRPDRRPALVVH